MSTVQWPSEPAPRLQWLLLLLGLLGAAVGLAATYLHYAPIEDAVTAMVASFASYGLLGYLAAVVFLGLAVLRSRHRGLVGAVTLLSVLALVLQASWVTPLFVPDHRPVTTPAITLLSLNMLAGGADPDQLTLQAAHADVVVLVEYSPDAGAALARRGWNERYPYQVGAPGSHQYGTAVYSRFPITDAAELTQTSFMEWQMAVHIPRMGTVELIAAHPCNPFCGYSSFVAEHQVLRDAARPYLSSKLIIAGDLNATIDHQPIRQLESDGLRSAADLVGVGWLPTYPANRRFPPLIGIDYVLVSRSLTATSLRAFTVAGTDHRGLVATIAGSGT